MHSSIKFVSLLDLPDELLLDVYSEWLFLEDFALLDTALCHVKRRKDFLRIISGFASPLFSTHRYIHVEDLEWSALKGLSLKNIDFYVYEDEDEPNVMLALHCIRSTVLCDRLEELTLNNSGSVNEFLEEIAAKCFESIKTLDLSYCDRVIDSVLVPKCSNFSKLQVLKVCGISTLTDTSIIKLVNGYKRLKFLDVSEIYLITDASISAVADMCPCLEVLKVNECPRITAASIIKVTEKCLRLQGLHLNHVEFIKDSFLHRITAGSARSLTTVSIGGNKNITDEALVGFVQSFPKLVYINIQDCPNITNQSIIAIAKECLVLRSLILSGCKLTDSAIEQLATHSTRLKHLYLDDCAAITNRAVIKIANNLPDLLSLSIRNCKNITAASLWLLAFKCKSLQSVSVRGAGLTANRLQDLRHEFEQTSFHVSF